MGPDQNVICPSGQVLSWEYPCHGRCLNSYSERNSTSLGDRATYPCDSGDYCAPLSYMCQGEVLCKDKSDLKACNSDLKCYGNNYEKYEEDLTLVDKQVSSFNYSEINYCNNNFGVTCGDKGSYKKLHTFSCNFSQ